MGNIKDGQLDLTNLKFLPKTSEEFPSLFLKEGDLLFNRTNSAELVGKSAIYLGTPSPCSYASYLVALRLGEACDSKYLCFCLNSHLGRLWVRSVVSQQVGQANVNSTKLRAFQFPLAPLNEQRRIVAKIEELFSDLDAGVAALRRAKANLKRYRASVLKAAVEGKLTEEWRASQPARESASALLARILKERRQKWEADQLTKFAAAGKEPPKNWREKYVEPELPDATGLPSIPQTWTWATLEGIADVVGGITKDQKKANRPGTREVPYLRVANVQRGFLDLSELKRISASEEDIAELRLEPGDVLFNEGGDRDKLGRGWVWSGELTECIHQNHVFRGRLVSQELQPRFVSHHGNTFGKEWFVKAGKQTTNLASINLGVLRRFPVPIPPAAEQAVIVALVDEKSSQIDAAETEIERGLLRAARLRQSILKQAFEGRLVPQDLTDEPASVLLDRARRQLEMAPTVATPRFHEIKTLPKEVFLRRASVVSYAVRRLAGRHSFGRTQLEKILHLAQSHVGIDLGFHFERYKAGPFDKSIYLLEHTAAKREWFATKPRATSKGVTYHPGPKIDEMCRVATEELGTKRADFDRLLDHIAAMNTDDAELFATAYAAWNDLLIDGRPADDDSIIAEIHGWHPDKARFTPALIRSRLNWMRTTSYVPQGCGQRTLPVKDSPSPRSGRRRDARSTDGRTT